MSIQLDPLQQNYKKFRFGKPTTTMNQHPDNTPGGGSSSNAAKRQRTNQLTLQVPSNPNITFHTPRGSATDLTSQEVLTLRGQALIFYKTLRKIERGILKADHHHEFLASHLEKGTTPRGLQANITSQIPDISTEFQLKWETAHLSFSTDLTTILNDYWTSRSENLKEDKDKLLTTAIDKCSEQEITDIKNLLTKLTIKPPTNKEKSKPGGSKSPRNRSPQITPSTSQTNI